MLRSHAAGSLRSTDAGQTVTLAGWVARRRDHGGVILIDLRDASGVSQVVFRDAAVLEQAHRLRAEFCVLVTGVVEVRPDGNANKDIATGDIEVNATTLEVLSESAPLPFVVRSSSGSCMSTGVPSAVRRTSVSMKSTPCSMARRNAASVFSGAIAAAPRCEMMPTAAPGKAVPEASAVGRWRAPRIRISPMCSSCRTCSGPASMC